MHKNRVYAVKFDYVDQNLLLTAGWDETLILWDIRVKKSVNYIYGPLICGDSLDSFNNTILTGSWREENQVETWDIRTLKKINTFRSKYNEKGLVYAAKFGKFNSEYLFTGTTSLPQINLFNSLNGSQLENYNDIKQGIFTIDSCFKRNSIVAGGGDGKILIFDIL